MKTTEFLKAAGLDALCQQYAISARRHGEFPNLVLLKYSQIDSPMGEQLVQECRGLILDEASGWEVVSRPYDKFFNHGEGHAAPVDWSTARVYEKLDGSLMTLYHYRGEWRVSSSGTPDAAGPAHASGTTFADLFWRVWRQLGYTMPTDTGCAYMFELMTPWNRIIVPHSKSRIVLHGCRELVPPFREITPEAAAENGWEVVKSYPLGCIDDCLTAAAALNPMESEGYIVCDAKFRRVKVKSPQYVALAHMKDGMTSRRLLEIIRANESSEFLVHFPEWADAYNTVRDRYDAICADVEAEFERLRTIPVQKDFAMVAVNSPASSALFSMRAGKCQSAREFFARCTLPALERMIDLSDMAIIP